MFETIFQKLDPQKPESFGILKFFSEDLKDDELLIFIQELESKDSFLLLTQIGGNSENQLVKEKTLAILESKFEIWIKNEIIFCANLQVENPRLTRIKNQEFVNFMHAISTIRLSSGLKTLLSDFIQNAHQILCGKYFESAFRFLFLKSEVLHVEEFGNYLLGEISKNPNNLNFQHCFHFYLNELAFSRFIFELNKTIINQIESYRKHLIENRLFNLDKYTLKSTLLCEIITTRELNLRELDYSDHINSWLIDNRNENFKNLDLLKFLARFNYDFKGYDFKNQIIKFLKTIEFRETEDIEFVYNKLGYITKMLNSSNLISDYIIFHLEKLPENQVIDVLYFIKNIFEKIKTLFNDVVGFSIYNRFKKVSGEKNRIIYSYSYNKKIPRGFTVRLNDNELKLKSKSFIANNERNISSNQLNYGFLDFNNKTFKGKKRIAIHKINPEKPNLEHFQIISINYSAYNKGQVFKLMPFDMEIENLSTLCGIENLFGKFDVWVLDQSLKICRTKLKLDGLSLRSISHHFHYDFNESKLIIKNYCKFKNFISECYKPIYTNIFLLCEGESFSFQKIQQAFKNNSICRGTIIHRLKGGYNVNFFGLIGFLPGSYLELSKFEYSHDSKKS